MIHPLNLLAFYSFSSPHFGKKRNTEYLILFGDAEDGTQGLVHVSPLLIIKLHPQLWCTPDMKVKRHLQHP